MSKDIKAEIVSIKPLTDTVLQLILSPEQYVDYQPGQYLKIVCDTQELSYSIANAPLGAHKYELHIRHTPDNPANQALLKEIKARGFVDIHVPFGDCSLDRLSPDKSIIFIAGGTGFAPVKAMIEQLLVESGNRHFSLFWIARNQSDLYMNELAWSWQSHVKHFRYFSLLTAGSNEKLIDRVNSVYSMEALLNQQLVMSGPFDLVYHLRDLLVAQGLSKNALYSDAFSFEQS